MYGGGSFASSDAEGSSGGGGNNSDSESSFHSRSRGPWPVAIQRPETRADAAAAAPALAADEEEGGPQPRWWRRARCCAGGAALRRPAAPGWLKLHWMQLRLMKVGEGSCWHGGWWCVGRLACLPACPRAFPTPEQPGYKMQGGRAAAAPTRRRPLQAASGSNNTINFQ